MHDPKHTVSYLSVLLQEKPEKAAQRNVMWRAIWREKNGPKPVVLRGCYDDVRDKLTTLNAQGYGIYLQVNAGDGTKARHITNVRALFVDCDVGDLPTAWPDGAAPSFVVQSGRGQHAYWVVPPDPSTLATFESQQKALAWAMGTDTKIHDLPRVMRVPGFLWTKPDDAGAWLPVTFLPGPGPTAPRAAPELTAALTIAPRPPTPEWARYRIVGLCNLVMSAPPAASQNTFNRCAFEAKDYVRAGLIEEAAARRALAEAGEERDVDGIEATLDSAFSADGAATWSGVGGPGGHVGGALIFPSGHEEDIARARVTHWGDDHVCAVGGILYRYDPTSGTWSGYTDAALRSMVASYHKTPYVRPDGVVGRLAVGVALRTKVAQALLETPGIFRSVWSASRGLAFADGFLGVDGQVVPHAAAHGALWRFEWAWGPTGPADAPPPAWARFFDDIWANVDAEERALRGAFLGAWFGSALMGIATRWATVALCVGDGANGKSVLLDALCGVLETAEVGGGARVTSAVPPKMWGNEYYRAQMRPPVILNTVAEIPPDEWITTDQVKGVVAGDKVSAREPYGRPMEFRPMAGHLFMANELPASADRSTGFWRRVEVLPFEVSFLGRERPSWAIVAELVAEAEAMVRWSVGWALSAVEMGSLPTCSGSVSAKAEWRHENDPVAQWLEERTEAAPWPGTFAASLYADFGVWAQMHGFAARSSAWWGRQMRRLKVTRERHEKGNVYLIRLR